QAREVDDVLARGQALVQAARVGQHAQAPAYRDRIGRRVDAIDQHLTGIGLHQRVQTTQRRRFAGAVRAEQAGDFAVAREKGNAIHRSDALGALAEGLVQISDFDHGAAPLKFTNAGMGPSRSTHFASSVFGSSLSTKSPTSFGMQPRPITLWPWPFATISFAFENPFITCSP